jgi:hypothetical protein
MNDAMSDTLVELQLFPESQYIGLAVSEMPIEKAVIIRNAEPNRVLLLQWGSQD